MKNDRGLRSVRRKKRKIGRGFLYGLILLIVAGASAYATHKYDLVTLPKKQVAERPLQPIGEENNHKALSLPSPHKAEAASAPPNVVNDQAIDDYLKTVHFNGSAIVVKNGKVLLNKGYGLANTAKKVNNNKETVYYIGSISKSFTSVAFMQLQEEGEINRDDAVSKYLPDFPHGNKIKLFNLLTHTSGISGYKETQEPISRSELEKRIANSARMLLFTPGMGWHYTDSNYALLGMIIEKVTGEPLQNYIQTHIFQVAGMKHAGFGNQFYKEKYPSTSYRTVKGRTYSPKHADFSQLVGCGDVYATAEDMYKFDHALRTGKLMSPASYKQMVTPYQHHYGFGMYINRKGWFIPPGNISAHGVIAGWDTSNSFSKDGKVYVVLLANAPTPSFGTINKTLYQLAEQSTVQKNKIPTNTNGGGKVASKGRE